MPNILEEVTEKKSFTDTTVKVCENAKFYRYKNKAIRGEDMCDRCEELQLQLNRSKNMSEKLSELTVLQQEYIAFLRKEIRSTASFLDARGYKCEGDSIKRGEEMRNGIANKAKEILGFVESLCLGSR